LLRRARRLFPVSAAAPLTRGAGPSSPAPPGGRTGPLPMSLQRPDYLRERTPSLRPLKSRQFALGFFISRTGHKLRKAAPACRRATHQAYRHCRQRGWFRQMTLGSAFISVSDWLSLRVSPRRDLALEGTARALMPGAPPSPRRTDERAGHELCLCMPFRRAVRSVSGVNASIFITGSIRWCGTSVAPSLLAPRRAIRGASSAPGTWPPTDCQHGRR
jgi:hypothetical protein